MAAKKSVTAKTLGYTLLRFEVGYFKPFRDGQKETIMQFLPDEKTIVESNSGFPALTTHRLWFLRESGSQKQLRAILLEDLCSCSLTYRENPFWLGLVILVVALGVTMALADRQNAGGILIGAAVMAVLFWLLYRASKRQYLNLAAASGEIAVQLPGDGFQQATAFVDSVLAAKNERCLISNRGSLLSRAAGA